MSPPASSSRRLRRRPQALIERYNTHTCSCKVCSGALRNVRILRGVAAAAGVVAAAMSTGAAVVMATLGTSGHAAPAWASAAAVRVLAVGLVAAAAMLLAWTQLAPLEKAFLSGPYPPFRQKRDSSKRPLTVVASSVVLNSVA